MAARWQAACSTQQRDAQAVDARMERREDAREIQASRHAARHMPDSRASQALPCRRRLAAAMERTRRASQQSLLSSICLHRTRAHRHACERGEGIKVLVCLLYAGPALLARRCSHGVPELPGDKQERSACIQRAARKEAASNGPQRQQAPATTSPPSLFPSLPPSCLASRARVSRHVRAWRREREEGGRA